MSPSDPDAYFGPPDLFTPVYERVHVSVLFTWDLPEARRLAAAWAAHSKTPVEIGGPAVNGESRSGFTPGLYHRPGIVITSRGCPNRCPWCSIRAPLKEIDVYPGNNIIDNNLLACSTSHLDKVFSMLTHQREIKLSGGLEAGRITEKVVERLRALRVQQLFTAYDSPSRLPDFKRAVSILRRYFTRWYVRAFVLIGYAGDTLERAEVRLLEAWEAGATPFAMLYRGTDGTIPEPTSKWRALQRVWARPALTKARVAELGEGGGP